MSPTEPGTIRAVVFDFDGVLANTEDLHLAAFQDTFRTRGWSLDRDAYFSRYLGFDDRGLIREFGADNGLRFGANDIDAILDEKSRLYEARIARGEVLYPTAKAAIARLGAEFKLAIASGSLRGEILTILRLNQLAAAFPIVVGADEVPRSKPAPDPYMAAVDRLGVAPSAAVAIEDAPLGLLSARTAGLHTIGITTSYRRSALADAHAVVDSLDEITVDFVRRTPHAAPRTPHLGGPTRRS